MAEKIPDYEIIVYESDEGGYFTDVPAFPGLSVEGDTPNEVLENTKEEIAFRVEELRAQNKPLPEP